MLLISQSCSFVVEDFITGLQGYSKITKTAVGDMPVCNASLKTNMKSASKNNLLTFRVIPQQVIVVQMLKRRRLAQRKQQQNK